MNDYFEISKREISKRERERVEIFQNFQNYQKRSSSSHILNLEKDDEMFEYDPSTIRNVVRAIDDEFDPIQCCYERRRKDLVRLTS